MTAHMTTHISQEQAALIAREAKVCANNYHPLPVVIARAAGVWLWDTNGRQYLDWMSAYSAVSHGHLHPRIVAAAHAQLQKVAVVSRAYHTEPLTQMLEKLVEVTGLDVALPMNSGAEAVETAIKAARRWGYRVKHIAPECAELLVARHNFHGRTTTIISASTEADYQDGFGPLTPGFRWFDFGDMASLEAQRTAHTCAVLVEPIQGEAGVIVPPIGWLKALRDWCTQHHILLILDEVQAGLGRTGRMFAYQHEQVLPDAVIVGKALGGGLLPVSALVGQRHLMNVFTPGSHGSTFGGNALAAAVAYEALCVLQEEQLVMRSAVLGDYLLKRLQTLQQRQPLIESVRGKGLWVGVSIRGDVPARKIAERMAEYGVLSKETHDTVIRIAPPLTITQAELDWGLEKFAEVLQTFQPECTTVHEAIASATAVPSSASLPLPQLLMSPPDFFEVSYSINPWMDPQAWAHNAPALTAQARAGWQALRQTYQQLGAQVLEQPAVQGLPDLVFTANCAVVLDGKVLLAHYLKPERQGEEAHGAQLFAQLQQQGLVQSIHTPPQGVYFEGAGDAIWDATRRMLWNGYGQRSSAAMRAVLEQLYQVPVCALELIDPRFYHLDTCFCVLSGGEVLYYPPAFNARDQQLIQGLLGAQAIPATEEDALHLGVNSVCIGRDIVMCYCAAATRQVLEARGYRVHVVDLGSFNRSGGAAYCLTLRLNNQT